MNTKSDRFASRVPRLRPSLLSAALAGAAFLPTAQADELTVFTDKPAYEVAQTVTLTVEGPPGAPVTILIDVDDGPTFVPGYGEFAIGFTPAFLMADLGTLDGEGKIVLSIPFLCRFAPVLGYEVYIQAVAFPGGAPLLSNPWHFTQSAGDCSDECVAGIEQMGVQTLFEDVPSTGELVVKVERPNGQKDVYGFYQEQLDLDTDALGVLDVPLENADGSIVVPILERIGDDLSVRICIDASVNGKNGKLQGGETRFTISYAGQTASEEIHTSCSLPLAGGDVFGDLVVTKLLFVQP
ncbi:MAG: hypothetical protein ACF8XB_03485 [Planctomycetota bacterium JB042]